MKTEERKHKEIRAILGELSQPQLIELVDELCSLLEPDIKKLRTELPNLGDELAPLLDRIGSPSPDKVKVAVESGAVSADEFKGAFAKTTKEYISVAVLKNLEN